MGQQSHVSKNDFYIYSTTAQSFKHYFLSFQVGCKTNISLENHYYIAFIVSLFPTAS